MVTLKELYEEIKEIDRAIDIEGDNTNWSANLECAKERLENIVCFLEEKKFESVSKIFVSGIQWDAPKSANLPKRVTIDIIMDNIDLLEDIDEAAENLSDYLSDEYEYCHYGFNVDVK